MLRHAPVVYSGRGSTRAAPRPGLGDDVPTITSACTYGIVNVANLDIQPDDALNRTPRASLNVTWPRMPTPRS